MTAEEYKEYIINVVKKVDDTEALSNIFQFILARLR